LPLCLLCVQPVPLAVLTGASVWGSTPATALALATSALRVRKPQVCWAGHARHTLRPFLGSQGGVLSPELSAARPHVGPSDPPLIFDLSHNVCPVCTPACAHAGRCIDTNTCDCQGTGYSGLTCSEREPPQPQHMHVHSSPLRHHPRLVLTFGTELDSPETESIANNLATHHPTTSKLVCKQPMQGQTRPSPFWRSLQPTVRARRSLHCNGHLQLHRHWLRGNHLPDASRCGAAGAFRAGPDVYQPRAADTIIS
jgi:hypothetical protein